MSVYVLVLVFLLILPRLEAEIEEFRGFEATLFVDIKLRIHRS